MYKDNIIYKTLENRLILDKILTYLPTLDDVRNLSKISHKIAHFVGQPSIQTKLLELHRKFKMFTFKHPWDVTNPDLRICLKRLYEFELLQAKKICLLGNDLACKCLLYRFSCKLKSGVAFAGSSILTQNLVPDLYVYDVKELSNDTTVHRIINSLNKDSFCIIFDSSTFNNNSNFGEANISQFCSKKNNGYTFLTTKRFRPCLFKFDLIFFQNYYNGKDLERHFGFDPQKLSVPLNTIIGYDTKKKRFFYIQDFQYPPKNFKLGSKKFWNTHMQNYNVRWKSDEKRKNRYRIKPDLIRFLQRPAFTWL